MYSKLRDLACDFYYGSMPAMAVDASGVVVDYNLALEAIFGDILSGRRGSHLHKVLGLMSPRVLSGSVIPQVVTLNQQHPECLIDSPDLGVVALVASSLRWHDPLANDWEGEIVLWSLKCSSESLAFHKRHRELLDEQLIWDAYAWSYDRILKLMPYYNEVVDRHAEYLSRSIGGPIIDLGAGTGNVTEKLIAMGRQVTAVDSSRAMLDRLRSKAPLASALGSQLTVVESTAESLPFDDESYGGVNILLALFDMRSPEVALRNAVGMLKAGGSIAITDLKRSFQLEPILQECERQLRNRRLYEGLADDLDRVVNSNHALNPGSRSGLRIENVYDFLAGEGFQGLEMKESHLGQCATVTGQKGHDATRMGNVAGLR